MFAAVEVERADFQVFQEKIETRLKDVGKVVETSISRKKLASIENTITESFRTEQEKFAIDSERQINELRKTVRDNFEAIQKSLTKKLNQSEFDDIKSQLGKKLTYHDLTESSNKLKMEVANEIQEQIATVKQGVQENMLAEMEGLTHNAKKLQSEISQLKEQTLIVTEQQKKECDEITKYFNALLNSFKIQVEEEEKI